MKTAPGAPRMAAVVLVVPVLLGSGCRSGDDGTPAGDSTGRRRDAGAAAAPGPAVAHRVVSVDFGFAVLFPGQPNEVSSSGEAEGTEVRRSVWTAQTGDEVYVFEVVTPPPTGTRTAPETVFASLANTLVKTALEQTGRGRLVSRVSGRVAGSPASDLVVDVGATSRLWVRAVVRGGVLYTVQSTKRRSRVPPVHHQSMVDSLTFLPPTPV